MCLQSDTKSHIPQKDKYWTFICAEGLSDYFK